MADVAMPRLSDSMEEGTIIKWLVSEGDEVKRGQEIAEIETDKANMTYEADTDGVLVEIVAQEGDTLEIGEVIARIGDAGEAKSDGGGKAEEGGDVTIVAVSRMNVTSLKAAETLASEHEVEAEVIDPRTLRPLDLDTIIESVKKTNRAVIVEEGWPHGGVGANLAALIQEQAFDWLDAPVQRVTGADVPMPYSKPLEQAAIPHSEHVVKAVLSTFGDL